MSSYLSVYIKPKEIDKKVLIYSYSRSSDIYQFFWENNLSTYAYTNALEPSEEKFKKLDGSDFNYAMMSLSDDIDDTRKKLSLMKEHKELTTLEDIMSLQEYLEEQIELRHSLQMIQDLIPTEYSCSDIENVYTNYD